LASSYILKGRPSSIYTEVDGPTPGTARRPISKINIKYSTRYNSTNMSSIEAALAAIESLEPGKKIVYA
jgi:hypothetical protein